MSSLAQSGVYSIRNVVNGREYFGKSLNIAVRWQSHLSELRRGVHGNAHLQHAFDKYGEDKFSFEVVCYCADPKMQMFEVQLIEQNSDAYNIRIETGTTYRHAEETKQKIAAAKCGHPLSTMHKQHIAVAKTGTTLPQAVRDKMKIAHSGKVFSEDHKAKIAAANRGQKRSAATCLKLSVIAQARKQSEITKRKRRETWASKREQKCQQLNKL